MLIVDPSDVLRSDAFRLAVGELIGVSGAVALAVHFLRRRSADRSALWFGLASVLYGFRLLCGMESLHTAFPHVQRNVVLSAITLAISYPFVLFLGATLGRAYPRYVRVVLAATALVTVDGTVRLILHAPMEPAWFLNGIVTVASVIGWIVIGIFPRIPINTEVHLLRIGLLVLGLSAVYQNLWVMRILPPAAWVEPLGMTCMLGMFFFVTVSRAVQAETHLIGLRSELDLARRIQMQLLPNLTGPSSEIDVRARYMPAGSVAGDFYEVLRDQHGIGVLIADVSGHGVPAALTASMVKVALRAEAECRRSPAKVLHGLNRTLSEMLQGQFITAAYVYVDPAKRVLRYAGAGHPPILVWRAATQQALAIEENGLFLGPFPHAAYSEVSLPFEPGDRCLLYTDGVLEAADRKGEEFGADRLLDALAAQRNADADDACGVLLGAVTEWSGGSPDNQQDDITFVMIEFAQTLEPLAVPEVGASQVARP